MPLAAKCVDLESVTPSEVKSDPEGEIVYDIPYMWNLKGNDINELTHQLERDRLQERAYGCWVKRGRKG